MREGSRGRSERAAWALGVETRTEKGGRPGCAASAAHGAMGSVGGRTIVREGLALDRGVSKGRGALVLGQGRRWRKGRTRKSRKGYVVSDCT